MFRETDNLIKPFHKSLTEWITGWKTAGPYLVNKDYGEQLLAKRGLESIDKSIERSENYFIKYLPDHLATVGNVDEIRKRLLDFEWLRVKLHIAGVFALREDYERVRSKGQASDDPLELVSQHYNFLPMFLQLAEVSLVHSSAG